jgi:predicted  nucleic acid-binding Zn-ribbon protein
MLVCTICGLWYPHVGADRLDICPECLTLNFPAVQNLDPAPVPWDVSAREALEASVDAAAPYQRAAMARLHARWRWTEEDAP